MADGSGLLEQLLHSDADVHGTRWFGTKPEPIATLLQGSLPLGSRAPKQERAAIQARVGKLPRAKPLG
jgi:hypothetical protein